MPLPHSDDALVVKSREGTADSFQLNAEVGADGVARHRQAELGRRTTPCRQGATRRRDEAGGTLVGVEQRSVYLALGLKPVRHLVSRFKAAPLGAVISSLGNQLVTRTIATGRRIGLT